MKIKALAGSTMAAGLLGIGILAGSVVGSGGAFAQTPPAAATAPAQAASTPVAGSTLTVPTSPGKVGSSATPITATLTQAQAEAAALAASPGNTIDHTSLQNQNGAPVYDVDFTNGGGVLINGDTGAVITVEAAGTDVGGHGGHDGHKGGANQAALLAQATVTQAQAEAAALTASAGNTVDHSRLQNQSGTLVWDVDFANGGGVIVNAQTGAIVTVEAAGTDLGGRPNAASSTPTAQP